MRQRALAQVSNKLPLFASCIVLEAFSLPAQGFRHQAQQALPVSTTFALKPSYASHSKPLHKTKHTSLVTKQSQGPLVTPQGS